MTHEDRITRFLAETADERVSLLEELVKVPSDNPPGDCAPHAERHASLLTELGLEVEAHPVPKSLCRANGMSSAVNIPACASSRPRVTPKKKRKAETAAFMEVAEAPLERISNR